MRFGKSRPGAKNAPGPTGEGLEQARHDMVKGQIADRGIRDERVLEAMRTIPRHRFVPEKLQFEAYSDRPLHIGCGQTISQPYMVALMTELLDVRDTDRVLEIGTGSGYQTAILSRLAEKVVSVERHEDLAEAARERLEAMGCVNTEVVCGDGTLGWPKRAPYDRILVTAGAPRVPDALEDQLRKDGKLVCPVGGREVQRLVVVTRTTDGLEQNDSIACVFVPLVGERGWQTD